METEKFNLPASKLPSEIEQLPEKEMQKSFSWRIFRIMAEFVEGWQFLSDLKKSVTFFGSARIPEGSQWYEEARKLGYKLAKDGYDVITGGGPGIMEAANRGAWEANEETGKGNEDESIGDSIGLNIKLPLEQRINRFVDKFMPFHYFFVRKVMLSYYAQVYLYFPGGYGTLDEAFELLTLMQTKKIPPIHVIFVGKEFWGGLDAWMKDTVLAKYQGIDKEDLDLYHIVDTAEEAYEIVKSSPLRNDFAGYSHNDSGFKNLS